MRAGKTKYPVGTRVRVANITDSYDKDLNGRVGELRQPFEKYPIGDVGIRLDPGKLGHPENITVKLGEFEIVG
jgi:hypothetical protein